MSVKLKNNNKRVEFVCKKAENRLGDQRIIFEKPVNAIISGDNLIYYFGLNSDSFSIYKINEPIMNRFLGKEGDPGLINYNNMQDITGDNDYKNTFAITLLFKNFRDSMFMDVGNLYITANSTGMYIGIGDYSLVETKHTITNTDAYSLWVNFFRTNLDSDNWYCYVTTTNVTTYTRTYNPNVYNSNNGWNIDKLRQIIQGLPTDFGSMKVIPEVMNRIMLKNNFSATQCVPLVMSSNCQFQIDTYSDVYIYTLRSHAKL